MKIKLAELYNAKESLNKLFNCDMPIERSFECKVMSKKIRENVSNIFSIRDDLVIKYGIEDKDLGKIVPVASVENAKKYGIDVLELKDTQNKFSNDFAKVLEKEIEVDITKLSITDLKGSKLSMNDLELLEFIIVK